MHLHAKIKHNRKEWSENKSQPYIQLLLKGIFLFYCTKGSGEPTFLDLNTLCDSSSSLSLYFLPVLQSSGMVFSSPTGYLYNFVSSVQFNHSVMSNSLRPHESQLARPPCPSPTPGVHSDSRRLNDGWSRHQWCHPAISSSVIPFSSCPQSLPPSETAYTLSLECVSRLKKNSFLTYDFVSHWILSATRHQESEFL